MTGLRLHALVISILSTGQIIGWGTTFYFPAVLADDIARDLGIAREVVFLGVTLMVGVGALVSPIGGRLMDRHGAGMFLPLGSLMIAAGLAHLATRPSLGSGALAFALFGLATPLSLSLAGPTLITQVAPAQARRGIAIMMVFTGLTSSVAWPITGLLREALGWQGTLLAFAAANFLLAAPLNAALARVVRAPAGSTVLPGQRTQLGEIGPLLTAAGQRRRARSMMLLAFALQGLGSWGLPLHLIAIFETLGLPSATAVAIAALGGPATLAARVLDVGLAGYVRPTTSALLAAALIPGAILLLLAPLDAGFAALAFTLVWFAANGVMSILRATLPLTLLGPVGYGALMGRLALPQQLAFAASPTLFAAAFTALGRDGGVVMGLLIALAALLPVLALARLVGGVREGTGG